MNVMSMRRRMRLTHYPAQYQRYSESTGVALVDERTGHRAYVDGELGSDRSYQRLR